MPVSVKRAYDKPEPGDGFRVLVDRLWPRGLTKEKLTIDEWMKEIAPSPELRQWYGHEVEKWPEFRKRYQRELVKSPAKELLEQLAARATRGKVTLVIGARDAEHANGAVIAEMIEAKTGGKRPKSASNARR
ncbi:MAG: DUF488 domain-containing protein [Terriglobia bacterium]